MKIRRFYFTKESEWSRNVRREDKDGPWCRYEDVEKLLERIKELEKLYGCKARGTLKGSGDKR